MSDWWSADPVVTPPPVGSPASTGGEQWWAADPVVGGGASVATEARPQQAGDDEGLGTTAWKSLQRGWAGLQQQPSMANIQAQGTALRQLNEYEAYLAGQSQRNPISRMADDMMNIRSMSPEQRAETRRMLEGNIGGSAANIAQKEQEIKAIGGPPPLVEKALQAKTFPEFWQYFSQAPVQFITSVGVESLPQMAPGLVAATVAGPMGGVPAAAGAIGVGSFATDFLSKLREGLQEEGVDWSNPEAVTQAMSNADLVNRVTSRAFRHAAPVGAIDAASMGVAGKTLVPARIAAERPVASQLANVGVQMPVQGAMGAAGEVAGSAAAGEEIKPGEVGAEFFGEFISAPADVATAALSRGRLKGRGAKRSSGPEAQPSPEAAPTQQDADLQKALAEFEALIADDPIVAESPAAAPQAAQDSPPGIRSGTEPEPAENAPSPVPESPATLKAQQEQILAGDRAVQMFPAGHPELPVPEGLGRIEAANGDVFHYDPNRINPFDILTHSNEGRENELLGLGPVTKTEALQRAAAGEQPVAVTERTPDGVEVRGAAGTNVTAPAQVAALNQVKSPDSTVQVESPEQVIADRAARGLEAGNEPRAAVGGDGPAGGEGALFSVRGKPDPRQVGFDLEAKPKTDRQSLDEATLGAQPRQRTAPSDREIGRRALPVEIERMPLTDDVKAEIVAVYNRALPSIERQYQKFAGEHRTYREITAREAQDTYGESEDWPDQLRTILERHGKAIETTSGRDTDPQWHEPDKAPTLAEHMRDAVEAEGGLTPARDLDDVMDGLATRTEGAEPAAAEAVLALAKHLGWRRVGSGTVGRYFTIERNGKEIQVRISDHSNLTRNPNAPSEGPPDINLAPGAHDFDDVARILNEQRSPGKTGASAVMETGADGKPQTVIPGAEKATQGEQAQRKADAPLTAKKAQKPADFGLFGDEKDQGSLFSASIAPPFYSAVLRAVENVKLTKAPAVQWLNTLRNVPGVKPEEMEWLGLSDWLNEQKGAVTKEAVLDYVRANQIEVKEVEKGTTKFEQAVEKRARELGEAENGAGSWDRIGGGGQEHYYRDARRELRTQFGGEEATPSKPKFPSYTLPGGENYRELLLTLPNTASGAERAGGAKAAAFARQLREKYGERYSTQAPLAELREYNRLLEEAGVKEGRDARAYRSPHFDEPNVLAHVRFNDRTIDGKRTLFIEEVQSDWHQAGKRKGYMQPISAKDRPAAIEQLHSLEKQLDDMGYAARDTSEYQALEAQIGDLRGKITGMTGVPDAPFKTTWPELAMKRMIRYAAENGYDAVAWTPGDVQAERYDLSKTIARVKYEQSGTSGFTPIADILENTGGTLTAYNHEGEAVISQYVERGRLADHIGKDVAEKLLAKAPREAMGSGMKFATRELSGLDLKVGGEGMLGFYDDILPSTVNKLVKKYGARVGVGKLAEVDVGDPKNITGWESAGSIAGTKAPAQSVHTLDITPALREAAVGQGFPMFDARRDLTAKARKAQPELKARLSAIIKRIAGDHVSVAFPDQIALPKSARTGWGSSVEGKETAAGAYMPADRLIRIALNDPMYQHRTNTAVHESFHAVEHLLLNDREMAVLKKAEPELRKQAQEFADLTEKQASELADYEVRAIAFEAYAHARENKQPVTGFSGAVRVVFERLRQGLERVRNALYGMGFKTAEDVFSDVYLGKMAGREAKPRKIGEAAKFDARGKVDPVDLSRFLRGELTAKEFAPGQDKWAKVESYLDKTFTPEQRRRMGQVMDAVVNGDPDMLDTLEGNERAIVQRLLDQSGYKPPSPPKAPPAAAGSGGGGKGAKDRILSRIVPSDKNAKKLPSLNDLYTMTKDDLNPLRVLRNELTDGKELPIEKDPYKLARLTRGLYGKAEQMLEHGTFAFKDLKDNGKSFKEVMEPVKKDLDGFRAYMAARRTIELAQRGIRTGIAVKDAASVVQEGAAKYAKPFAELVAYQRRVLDYLRDAGVVSPEGYAAMIEANKDYVPFYRLMDETGSGKPTNSRSLRVKDPIKGITGSKRQIIDPVESIIKNTYLYVALAEKNRALTALDDLATSSPKGEQFMAKPKDKPKAPQPDLPLMDFLKENGIDATPNDFSVFKPDAFRPSKDSIAFYRNGKREVRQVDPEVAEAVNALDRESFGLVMRILAMPARMLRLGATQSPEFIVRNPIRDQFSAFILSENGYVPVYDMLKGLGAIFTHDAGYQNWLKSGGANSTLLSVDRKYIEREVMKLSNPTVLGRIGNVVKSPIDFLRMVSELTENATRVGEFKRAMKKGKSAMEAGFGSREVTLDFARIGAQARGVNALIPFFNASIEGTDRETRAFIKKPLATSLKVAAAITLPSVLLWFANHDDDRYKELPQWQKDLFWIVLTKDSVWRIPKPFALGVLFGSVPERTLEAFYDKHPNAFKNLGKSLKDAFVPNMIPQFMAPSIEQYSNKSLFTDRPIVPKYLENALPEYQSTPFTSETAKLIGKAIARMGGDQSSFASPQVIDNYIRSWGGGLGQHAVAMADKGLKAAGVAKERVEPTKTWADIPVVKAFAVRHPSASAQSIQDFYDTYDERKKALGTVRHLTKVGQPDAADSVREDRNIETAEKIHKALGQQMKVARDVWLNDKITPPEKRALIDQTYMQAIEIAKRGNEIFSKTDQAKKDLKTSAKQLETAP